MIPSLLPYLPATGPPGLFAQALAFAELYVLVALWVLLALPRETANRILEPLIPVISAVSIASHQNVIKN
jgi:hypothetical protein